MTKITSKNSIDLLIELVKTSFKMRYQNSVLGFLWVLIKPYAMFLVMYLIFSNIIRSSVENYALYLLTGVIFITFINELLVLGQMSLLERAHIILKVSFPRYIAIVAALIGAVINLCINLILILFIVLMKGIEIDLIGIVHLILVITILFIWGVGMAFITSILTVRIRDLKNIIELGMFMMQYGTPIFYSLDDNLIPNSKIKLLIQYNPLTIMMNQLRAALNVYGQRDFLLLIIVLVLGLLFLFFSYMYFSKQVKKIAEFF
ncbi:ABC transporter permease [Candidatus Dojkabacteria bacterium]|uniref:Transport permease protein n=1 Tax=Candidatus Dojkabacteria bacterium TaxID=2099670 RepID=A0A955LAX5_9BACT|nr:ABC transporter permease [Candidatus Dojkabacteria bacterium]